MQDKEDGRNPDFTWTFVESFWWGLMTITTVGYDLNPRTYLGKLIGGFTAISGIFILTLPIPIVVNSFASYYKVSQIASPSVIKSSFEPRICDERVFQQRINLTGELTLNVSYSCKRGLRNPSCT